MYNSHNELGNTNSCIYVPSSFLDENLAKVNFTKWKKPMKSYSICFRIVSTFCQQHVTTTPKKWSLSAGTVFYLKILLYFMIFCAIFCAFLLLRDFLYLLWNVFVLITLNLSYRNIRWELSLKKNSRKFLLKRKKNHENKFIVGRMKSKNFKTKNSIHKRSHAQ